MMMSRKREREGDTALTAVTAAAFAFVTPNHLMLQLFIPLDTKTRCHRAI